jgi:hypothetical protein
MRCLLLCAAIFSFLKRVAEERARNKAAKMDARSVREICGRGRPKAAC